MTLNEFKATLQQTTPPSTLTPLLKAMWHEGKGDWEAAHNIAQEINTSEGSGSTLIFIGLKVTWGMLRIGITVPASQYLQAI